MKIVAVDDEALQLEKLVDSIREAEPEAEVFAFRKTSELLRFPGLIDCNAAFLDIEMPNISGIELAKVLREMNPTMNIIFVTGYSQYKSDAMDLRASGYVLKPVNGEKIAMEIRELRYPMQKQTNKMLQVKCFGNFDVFDKDDVPVYFERSKAKELLAYLVSREGSRCTTTELISALYEMEADKIDRKTRDSFQHAVSSLMKALKEIDASEVIVRGRQNYAVNPSLIDCDYYRFKKLDASAVNAYTGEFMSQYNWAEFITSYLNQSKND